MDALDSYGLSEVIGPGVAGECVETKDGLHIWEDHFYPEIIDPVTGAVLPDGAFGELVFTSLTKEAMPVIRYRTGDLTRLLPGTARSMRRMEKVSGRTDDMMIVRGVNVFPTQIEELLLGVPGLSPHYQLILTREGRLDELEVQVEARSSSELDEARAHAPPASSRTRSRRTLAYRESERAGAGSDRTIARQGEARHRQEAQSMTSSTESALGAAARRRPARASGAGMVARLPDQTGEYESDARATAPFGASRRASFGRCRAKPRRNEAERAAADALLSDARASRELFLAAHVEPVYDRLTERRSTFRRLDDLVYAAAKLVPGLVPTREEVDAEAAHPQRDKDGVEIDQGLFLAHVLARPRIGEHLCHAMLLPRPESAALVAEFAARGSLDLGAARLTATRQGGPSRHDQSALPQRRGRHDPRPDRTRRRRGDARSNDRDRRHARRCGGEREISRQAHFWRGHQSHPSLSRQNSLPLVPDPRPRLRAQAPARRRCAGERARRRQRPRRRKTMDRRGRHVRHRRPLPGAALHGLRSRRV